MTVKYNFLQSHVNNYNFLLYAGGEEDETDNNDQGLDDMNLHDEGVEIIKVVMMKENKMIKEVNNNID